MEGKWWIWVLVVFTVCLATRIYYVHEKSVIEGDELTSLTLAYNNIGWGDNTYLPGHTYNADELRSNLLADDRGGLAGYAADIKALWLDNRDASHASLYYMLLRTSLLMVGHASVDEAVRWGCGLNIAIFVLTFFLAAIVAARLLHRHRGLVPLALLLAFLNPLSISTTLLLREYQLAECLAAVFFLVFLRISVQIGSRRNPLTLSNIALASVAAAAFMSAGYFNTFLVLFACGYLAFEAKRNGLVGKTATMLAVCVPLCLVVAVMLYSGFFNFLTDVRTSEVVSKAQGGGFISNAAVTVKTGAKLVGLDILNPLLSRHYRSHSERAQDAFVEAAPLGMAISRHHRMLVCNCLVFRHMEGATLHRPVLFYAEHHAYSLCTAVCRWHQQIRHCGTGTVHCRLPVCERQNPECASYTARRLPMADREASVSLRSERR